jgi:hypothetical protein
MLTLPLCDGSADNRPDTQTARTASHQGYQKSHYSYTVSAVQQLTFPTEVPARFGLRRIPGTEDGVFPVEAYGEFEETKDGVSPIAYRHNTSLPGGFPIYPTTPSTVSNRQNHNDSKAEC